jgi:cysteinyl-tRNA synthetase
MDVIARKANRGTQSAADCLAATLEFFGFGLDTLLTTASAEAPAGVEAAVATRLAALDARDFATADRIRTELLEQGIQLMDSKNAAGERVTTWEVKR